MSPLFPYAAIALLGLVASFVGITTGGIGLVVVPALIAFGLPTHAAIGTMRFAIMGGEIVSLIQFHRAGKTVPDITLPIILVSILGAIFGSTMLVGTPGPLAEKLLGTFILLMIPFLLWKKDMGTHVGLPPPSLRKVIGYASLLGVSAVGAYFSAAAGLLGRGTLMAFFGQTQLQSSATRKIQGITVGIVTVVFFAWFGMIDAVAALVLTPAILLGSFLGSHVALRKGDGWVRMLFLGMVLLAGMMLLI